MWVLTNEVRPCKHLSNENPLAGQVDFGLLQWFLVIKHKYFVGVLKYIFRYLYLTIAFFTPYI